MKSKKSLFTTVLAVTMAMTALTACGSGADNKNPVQPAPGGSTSPAATPANDTITALLPPVSPNYQKSFDQIAKDFNALYPNLTLKIEPASWEDIKQKLDVFDGGYKIIPFIYFFFKYFF